MKEVPSAGRKPRRRRSSNPFRILWKRIRMMFKPKWMREYEKFKDR
ncbi:MAG: hypothetical protein JWO82_4421 [Akkermansiaceae bacterium]|nr:hypothetical protein [Akkermansiaceae bacterium]